MADRYSSTASGSSGRRFLSTRLILRALLIATGCLLIGLIMMGLALVPLADLQDELFSGAGSDLSTAMLFLGLVPCNIVAWVRASRWRDAVCIGAGSLTLIGLPAAAIALVRTGERRSLRADLVAAGATIACVTAASVLLGATVGAVSRPEVWVWGIAFSLILSAGCLLWGRVRGTRAALLVSLRQQTESAERIAKAERYGREADVARARAEERSAFAEQRSALARDMHDGISHRLSIVALHAGAISSREDLTPEQLRTAASTVRDAAEGTGVMLREALTALRGVGEHDDNQHAGFARSESSSSDETSLEARVSAARDQGAAVTLRWWYLTQGELDQTQDSARAIARITDEVLINALKYAPDQQLEINISVQQGELRLLARNPISAHRNDGAIGTGYGLIGATEQAELLGGGAQYGVTVDEHYQVDVWLPWPAKGEL